MITKIRFVRDQQGNPAIRVVHVKDGNIWVEQVEVSEEAYTEWVPVSSARNPEGSLPKHLLNEKS